MADAGDGAHVLTAGYTMQESRLPDALRGAHSAAVSQSAGDGSKSARLTAGSMAIEAYLP
jgi:hypothetical protein